MLADYKKTWEKITFLRSFNNTDPRTGPDLLGKPAVGDENLVVHYDIKQVFRISDIVNSANNIVTVMRISFITLR
jgi:hypothetical protein